MGKRKRARSGAGLAGATLWGEVRKGGGAPLRVESRSKYGAKTPKGA